MSLTAAISSLMNNLGTLQSTWLGLGSTAGRDRVVVAGDAGADVRDVLSTA
ncbi:hypothetical protein GCM10023162_30740 [Klenkia terrae]